MTISRWGTGFGIESGPGTYGVKTSASMPPGINITGITQPPPGEGAIFVMHCTRCHRTTITSNVYAVKPVDGDFWLFQDMGCPEFHPIEWSKTYLMGDYDFR